MLDRNDDEERAKLKRLNEELSVSLKRCRALLKDCRSRLAANSNELHSQADEDDESQSA